MRWLARQRAALSREVQTRLGPQDAGIFQAHSLMLADETLQRRLVAAIEDRACSAEEAVAAEFDLYKVQLGAVDSEYLGQRVADIGEIQQALLDHLNHVVACKRCSETVECSVGECRLGNEHILVGEELPASLPIETDDHTVGFIVEKGGPNSHAAILARALRRPAVGNIHEQARVIPLETQILINGDTGEVILNPSAQTLARHRPARGGGRALEVVSPVPGFRVMANIERSKDVCEARAVKAEGVGLYRTEMEMLVEGRLLDETEQAARYSEVVRAMAGRPVCIRLLDLGADKSAAWLGTSQQADTAPGTRGARLLLARPELLREQARALARASVQGPIHVLYPMIVDADQFLELRALFDQAVADLPSGSLRHGALFEIPSACFTAGRILETADFGCIGTNDLIQYLFAEDRGDGQAGGQPQFDTDAVLWHFIRHLSRTAAKAGKPMAICGELAGNPDLTGRIMQAGITTVSTSPAHIARVRRAALRSANGR